MEKKQFVNIIINNKSNKTDRTYTYKVPDVLVDKINIGTRVIVPFGRGNRVIEGFVVEEIDSFDMDPSKIKSIQRIVEEDSILSKEMIKLCRWMKEKYMCKFIDAINTVMPTGASLKQIKVVMLSNNFHEKNRKLSDIQNKLIQIIGTKKNVTEDFLKKQFVDHDVGRIIKTLEQKELIVVKSVLKSNVKKVLKKIIKLSDGKDQDGLIEKIEKRAKKQREVLLYLMIHKQVEWIQLKGILNVSLQTIKALECKGLIEMIEVEDKRTPYKNMEIANNKPFKLTKEQVFAIEQVVPYIDENIYQPFLIHGVTGSGKTEVYMRLIDRVINQSKEAIVLVPEIALTTQMIERFKARFGPIVAVLHSRLSLGERYDEWNRMKNGEAKIAIGARSAIFSPFKNLGLVIVDEEHETTYKSDYSPKYHAIDVAKFRCIENKAVLLLGSATPSVESYTEALKGEYHKITMLSRFNDNPLPSIEIVDMRDELTKGNKTVFSESLYKGIIDNLKKEKQTILFLNRRGYSTFISCRSCGYVVKCPYCEISLTFHSASHHTVCHYCGFIKKPPVICPECKSKYIKYFGIGTEKIENLTKKYFPKARVARLDLDTTSKKGVMDQTITCFKKGEIDILIGTQMIAKGLNFPNVTLVGVIAADTNLNLPDFRAAEKTFQLITQVAGRAGRGDDLGRVVVQTYEPENFAIEASKSHDYTSFYKKEILLRKEFGYPPYSNLINILFTGEEESEVIKASNEFANIFTSKINHHRLCVKEILFGPHPAALSKIKKKYRWQIIIKSKSVDQNIIKGIINDIRIKNGDGDHFKNIRLNIDVNPYSML